MILKVIVPGPVYMEESPESCFAKRALLGVIVFGVAVLALSVLSNTRFQEKAQNEIQWKFLYRNDYIEIIFLSLRFIFAGYFAMFWYNFLINTWYSRISLSFAYTFPQSTILAWIGCLSMACFLGVLWIVFEPWRKITTANQKLVLYNVLLARIIVYLALSAYFAVFVFFRFPIDTGLIFSDTIFLIVVSTLLGIYKPHAYA